MFNPRHLKAYLALVRCMHFGRAAETLGISQPTLSQQIRMLEDEVGAPLINRTNRMMELTAVGRVFAEDAQQILTLMDRAKRNAEDILSGEEAEVRLGVCPGIISSGFLINLLAEARRRWPRIKVLTEVSPPSSLAARLAKGQIDIYAGLTTGVDFPPSVVSRVIAEWDAVLAIPRSRLVLEETVSAEFLKGETFLYLEGGEAGYPHVVESILGFTPKATLSTPSSRLLMAYVDAGYGIALLPAPDAAMCGSNTLIRPVGGGRGMMKACAARLAVNNAPSVRRIYEVLLALARNGIEGHLSDYSSALKNDQK